MVVTAGRTRVEQDRVVNFLVGRMRGDHCIHGVRGWWQVRAFAGGTCVRRWERR